MKLSEIEERLKDSQLRLYSNSCAVAFYRAFEVQRLMHRENGAEISDDKHIKICEMALQRLVISQKSRRLVNGDLENLARSEYNGSLESMGKHVKPIKPRSSSYGFASSNSSFGRQGSSESDYAIRDGEFLRVRKKAGLSRGSSDGETRQR